MNRLAKFVVLSASLVAIGCDSGTGATNTIQVTPEPAAPQKAQPNAKTALPGKPTDATVAP